jgi:hypothetical protein
VGRLAGWQADSIKWAGAAAGDVGTERVLCAACSVQRAATQPERTSEQSDRYQRVKKAGRAQSRSFSNLRRCSCEWLAQPQRRDAQHRPTRPTLKVGPLLLSLRRRRLLSSPLSPLSLPLPLPLPIHRPNASCLPIHLPIHVQHRQPCGSSSNAPSRLEALPARQVPSAPGCNPARQYPRASRRVTATRGDRGPALVFVPTVLATTTMGPVSGPIQWPWDLT